MTLLSLGCAVNVADNSGQWRTPLALALQNAQESASLRMNESDEIVVALLNGSADWY